MEQKTVDAISQVLREAGIRFERGHPKIASPGADVTFRMPDTGEILLVHYHYSLAPFQVKAVLERLQGLSGPKRRLGLCVRRMSLSLLDACKEAGVAVFDLEGNAYMRLPGVYVERIRPGRARGTEPTAGTVFTAKASRLVRAFLHRYPHDWSQARLVEATGLSAGYVSTLVKRLVGQGYVSNRSGRLYLDDPDRVLDDWASHYRFDRHRKLSFAIAADNYEDGIAKLGNELAQSVSRFGWTGWTGAHLRAPYATPTKYMAYVVEPPTEMKGVFPVATQGNVTLYVPHDEGVFQFSTPAKHGETVSDAQLYVDLCRMPGRAKEQADALRHHRLEFARITQ